MSKIDRIGAILFYSMTNTEYPLPSPPRIETSHGEFLEILHMALETLNKTHTAYPPHANLVSTYIVYDRLSVMQ